MYTDLSLPATCLLLIRICRSILFVFLRTTCGPRTTRWKSLNNFLYGNTEEIAWKSLNVVSFLRGISINSLVFLIPSLFLIYDHLSLKSLTFSASFQKLRCIELLAENNFFSLFQSGFRSYHSSQLALLKITNNIHFNIDQKHTTLIQFKNNQKIWMKDIVALVLVCRMQQIFAWFFDKTLFH